MNWWRRPIERFIGWYQRRYNNDPTAGMRPLVKALYVALGNPDNWEMSQYTITFKRTKAEFWIANGAYGFKPYRPVELSDAFSDSEKAILWARYSELQQMKLLTDMLGV